MSSLPTAPVSDAGRAPVTRPASTGAADTRADSASAPLHKPVDAAARADEIRKQREAETYVEQALQKFDPQWRSLRFKASDGHVVIEVLDATGEVVRSIPPDKLRELADALNVTTGLLVDSVR